MLILTMTQVCNRKPKPISLDNYGDLRINSVYCLNDTTCFIVGDGRDSIWFETHLGYFKCPIPNMDLSQIYTITETVPHVNFRYCERLK